MLNPNKITISLRTVRVRCVVHIMAHWTITRVLAERLVVAATIVAMMALEGFILDRTRVMDAITYAIAEVVTKIRFRG